MGSIMTSSYTYIMVWITFGPSPCLVPFPLPLIPLLFPALPRSPHLQSPFCFHVCGKKPTETQRVSWTRVAYSSTDEGLFIGAWAFYQQLCHWKTCLCFPQLPSTAWRCSREPSPLHDGVSVGRPSLTQVLCKQSQMNSRKSLRKVSVLGGGGAHL